MNGSSISILVNTTDSFEDCWVPFFTLFKNFWPSYSGKIYLNTETKDFSYSGLNIVCIKNGLINHTWSQCLIYALDTIEEDLLIYMQEDYFLDYAVNIHELSRFLSVFKRGNYDCLHLTNQCNQGPFIDIIGENRIWEIPRGVRYRASTQAAIWRKEALSSILVPWENGWEFERFGSKRSNIYLSKVVCVNQDLYGSHEKSVISYVFTGIIKGKWNKAVVECFQFNNIVVNYTLRGFVSKQNKFDIKQKFRSILRLTRSSLLDFYYTKLYN